MEDKKMSPSLDYGLFSRYRGELMGFAMLWIMLFHAFAWLPRTPWIRGFKELGFFGVDIFIFLSALGLSLSLSRKKQSYGAYLKRRLVRILPTYWLVTLGYGLALRLAGRVGLKTVAWTTSTLFYWLDKPHYFNWYIPALLFFYLLAPLATTALTKARHRRALTVALCLLTLPLAWGMERCGLGHLTLDLVPRLPVFLLGTLAGTYIAQGRALTPKRLWLWAALPFLVPVGKALTGRLWYSGCFSFALGCVAVCLLLAGLVHVLPGWAGKALRTVGACSLEIYLLNVVFVREYDLLAPLFPSVEVQYAVTIPANLLLGVGLHYALKRPMAWLTAKITGSASPSRPPEGEEGSAEGRSGR